MTIRDAEPEDIPALVAMGRRFLAESSYQRHVVDNPAQMASCVTLLIESPDGAVFVSEVEDELTGTIALICHTHPFSGERTVTEMAWWVEPEHRGHGLRLLKRAEQWAADQGAAVMQMIAPTVDVGRVYARLGYDVLECAYQRRLTAWPQSQQR